MKKLFVFLGLVGLAGAVVSCVPVEPTNSQTTSETPTKVTVQGVTATTIKVGNTAATSGGFAAVGVPFNDAIKAVFKQVNDAGGIDGRKIEFVTYDDQFDAAKGKTFTEKLIEEDKIFALVGHFGTPTVGATLDTIKNFGLPMVYAATGINALYTEQKVGEPVMPVQPIYLTDGRLMLARAVKEKVYGATGDQALPEGKIGVFYTNDDAGNSIKAGIEAEAVKLNVSSRMTYEVVSDLATANTAANKFVDLGVKSVVLAMNQTPFAYSLAALNTADLKVPVFTSYVNADVTYVDYNIYNAARPIFTNAWVDVYSEKGAADVQGFVAAIAQADLPEATKNSYYTNAFATAGYIAAKVFIAGLERVRDSHVPLTFANYIAAMEQGPISIPMGGTVDFSNGHRWGIDSMSLLKFNATKDGETVTKTFVKVREIETIAQIEAKH